MRIYAGPIHFLQFPKSLEDCQFNEKQEDKKRKKESVFDS